MLPMGLDYSQQVHSLDYILNYIYITYPLSCASFSESQYSRLHKTFIPTAISALGYNRYWRLALRYDKNPYGGLQLNNFEFEALILKIKDLNNLLCKTETSKIVKILLYWFQHVAGTSFPILECPPYDLQYVNSIWVLDLIRLLRKYKVTIHLEDKYLPKPQRQNDSNIMDIVNHHTTLVPTLKKINGCRLYLEAQYISDIAHISGKTLTPGVSCGSTSNLSQSTLQWPNQSKPNDATWKVWKHFITQTFCSSAGKYDLQPQYILGCWLSKPSERNKIHRFQYSPSLNGIFISESNRIQR